jgi:hypothetical protein
VPSPRLGEALARAHQNLIWSRQRQANALRSALREFYPAALVAFDKLAERDALVVLDLAPTPTRGRALSKSKIASALRRAGRQRNVDAKAAEVQAALRTDQLAAPAAVEVAFGHTVTALVRVLAEFGDDPTRLADAKARRNYAATSPSPGRPAPAGSCWPARRSTNASATRSICKPFAALRVSPGGRAYYDAHRARGHTHHQALRALGNRLVGILYGCLRHRQPYNEATAWSPAQQPQLATAA